MNFCLGRFYALPGIVWDQVWNFFHPKPSLWHPYGLAATIYQSIMKYPFWLARTGQLYNQSLLTVHLQKVLSWQQKTDK